MEHKIYIETTFSFTLSSNTNLEPQSLCILRNHRNISLKLQQANRRSPCLAIIRKSPLAWSPPPSSHTIHNCKILTYVPEILLCAASNQVSPSDVSATNATANAPFAIPTFDLQPSSESVTNAALATTKISAWFAVARYVFCGTFSKGDMLILSQGISDAFYCFECTRLEKDRDGCPKIINLGSSRTDLFYQYVPLLHL